MHGTLTGEERVIADTLGTDYLRYFVLTHDVHRLLNVINVEFLLLFLLSFRQARASWLAPVLTVPEAGFSRGLVSHAYPVNIFLV